MARLIDPTPYVPRDSYRLHDIAEQIKIQYCNINKPYRANDDSGKLVSYTTAGGETVQLTEGDMFKPPEVMFEYSYGASTSKIGEAVFSQGLNSAIEETFDRLNGDHFAEVWANIVLGGGNSKLEGFGKRIKGLRLPRKRKSRVIALENREYSAWIGTSKFTANIGKTEV